MEIPFRDWDREYARNLLGDDVVGAVREVVDAESCFFVSSSASLVLGLSTGDGSRVALKIVPLDRRTPAQVEAVVSVQRALHERGFPAPRPLAAPRVLGRGVATLDEWVEGEQRDLHDPAHRRRAARLLTHFVARAPAVDGLPGGLASGADGALPLPHHPRFDFDRPEGAWIDDVAAAARLGLRLERDVVGHSDWSTKNMSWRDGDVVAVYDWADSCLAESEATIVGQASVFFPATWDEPFEPKHGTPDEMREFVDEYEEAAGRRLDPAAVRAAQLYVAAYSARCEISGGREGAFCALLRELSGSVRAVQAERGAGGQ